jgi:hypothetical protein
MHPVDRPWMTSMVTSPTPSTRSSKCNADCAMGSLLSALLVVDPPPAGAPASPGATDCALSRSPDDVLPVRAIGWHHGPIRR